MKEYRILSYNIHKGFSLNRKFMLNAIREAIHATNADLVFLQEVVGENQRHAQKISQWPVVAQLDYLADSMWAHSAYGKNAVYQHGHHGNAILSRRAIIKWENIDISNNRLERRGLLHAVIESSGRPGLHAICVHLDLFAKGRKAQLERIIARIKEHVPPECPLILAGDFNDWSEVASPHLKSELDLREAFFSLHNRHARSFPAWFPFLPLDRIYTRGFHEIEANCFVSPPWDQLSDHGAVMAVLRERSG